MNGREKEEILETTPSRCHITAFWARRNEFLSFRKLESYIY